MPLTLALLVLLAPAQAPPDAPEVPPAIRELVDAHNERRAAEGLGPLQIDPKLMAAALAHARDMAEHQRMSHEGSDGSSPAERVRRQGYTFRRTGENVAAGQDSVAEVMEGWMNSPPHKANILGDFTQIGAARADDADGHPYWSVSFGLPIPRLDPDQAARDVASLLNRARSAAEKPPLEPHPALAAAARAAADALARRDSLQPDDSEDSPALAVLTRAGYAYRQLRQDTGSGYPTPEAFFRNLDEPDRRDQTVLGPYRHLGVGYARADDGTPYWVALFATPR